MKLQLTGPDGRPTSIVYAEEIAKCPGWAVHHPLNSLFGPPSEEFELWTVSHIETGCTIRSRSWPTKELAVSQSIAFLSTKTKEEIDRAVARAKKAIARERRMLLLEPK